MTKKWLLITYLFLCLFHLQAQNNAWINYSQSYYQIKIGTEGIYRLNYSSLQNAAIPINSLDPRSFQLFARGQEIPIYIKGENDGVFDVTDFIEFYAYPNDGWIDSVFYQGRNNQANPYYSLLSDTITYYLTWNTSTSNRRIQEENAVDFGNYFKADYLLKERIQTYSGQYYPGEPINNNATDPDYVDTEAWMDNSISLGQSKNYALNFNNRYLSGPFIELEMTYTGQSNWALVNSGDHHLRIEVGGQVRDDIFEGYQLRKQQFSFSPAAVPPGNHNLLFRSINDLNSGVDRMALAYIKYTYPHSLVLDNSSFFNFILEDNTSQNKTYLDLINFNGGSNPILYDLSNNKRVKVIESIGSYKALVPNGGGRKRCVVLAESEVIFPAIVSVGNNNRFIDYASIAPDSAYILLSRASILPEVTRYAAYRSGTGFNPLIVDYSQIVHQYGFGIPQNPLAIRDFVNEAFSSFSSPPAYLFLIGKSVNVVEARKDPLKAAKNLIPSYGNPSADNLLTAGLQQTNLESPVPLGRLSAKTSAEVGAYLDKVIAYESASHGIWQKRALHFAGGLSQNETDRFEGYLNGFASNYSSSPYGGEALLFKKSTSVPIQTTLSDSIRSLINNGIGLMTFFGHAAATGGFDISIDSPDQLNNRGFYPTILANSCFSGNYHQADALSVSEQYILEPNKGAIAFIASGNLGFASTLNTYSGAFYQNFAGVNYNKSIAENMIATVQAIQAPNTQGNLRLVCLEMSLQGDPAIKLNPQEKPDYVINASSIRTSPTELSTELDSFDIKINIENWAKAIPDTLLVQLERGFPNAGKADTFYLKQVTNLFYKDQLVFRLPIDLINGVGLNEFTVLLDPNNSIDELDEFNNRVDFELLIRAGEIIPVFPPNFSIIGQQNTRIKASTAFAMEQELSYQFEIDTSYLFNSSTKETQTILSRGGVVEWVPNLLNTMQDSAVYFWRVAKSPAPGESPRWRSASFQYLANESGWSQSAFGQQISNTKLFLDANSVTRQYEFVDNVKELYVQTIGSPSTTQNNDIKYAIDTDIRERNACGASPGFLIAVLDSVNLESWQTPYGGANGQNYFGQANFDNYCAPNRLRPEKYFLFRANDTMQMQAMRDFLLNEIPNGNYIVAYTWQSLNYDAIWAMDSSYLKAFEQLGSTLIKQLNTGIPFIFTAQKANLASVQETAGASINSTISIRRTLTISADYGEVNSVTVPLGKNISRLKYRFKSLESNSQDAVQFNLLAFEDQTNNDDLLAASSFSLDTSISNLVAQKNYQSLTLKYRTVDLINQTPAQLKYWQIQQDLLPDFAMAPNLLFFQSKDSLNEGEDLSITIGIENTSNVASDSLEIAYQIINQQNQVLNLGAFKQRAIAANTLDSVKLTIPTIGLVGNNQLIITANPNNEVNELYTFNNTSQIPFTVLADKLAPFVEVTFDGRRIINRELVSAKPDILIQLSDENNYLALDDTSLFTIFLRDPSGNEELLNFGSSNWGTVNFIPASLPDNRAKVNFRPDFSQDGIYALRIQAYDKTGNASGKTDYQIEFEVITKSSISHLVNYPNPFSTSTRFVFTLTGSQIPDQIQIQIMTITGKVVREIDQFEIGPIHIGNNISEFAWDGKDEFGDQLANGVYLYRVRARINGQNIERRDTKANQFFTKEFGKMYLLR